MNRLRTAGRRRPIAIAGALAALVVALLASLAIAARPEVARPAGEPAKRAACPGADVRATEATAQELRATVRCLINRKRARRGAEKVVRHPALRKAAQRHTATMVDAGCLAHRCGDEPDLEERLRRAGYFEGAKSWSFVENTGCATGAGAMVANWFHSREHRLNLLDETYRDIGIGVVTSPVPGECGARFAAFTVVLGWREPA
jgi:uncharacterized protein YkwD